MTDHPGPTPPTGEPAEGDADPLAAALDGPAWDAERRRRRSAEGADGEPPPRDHAVRRTSSRSGRRAGPSRPGTDTRERPGSRRSRHTRVVVVHVVLGVLGLGLAWVVVTGLLAALQLQQARGDLTTLRTAVATGNGDVTGTVRDLAAHAHHADVLTAGPAWAVAARVPYLGEPLEAVRGVTRETSALVDRAAPDLVAVAGDVNPRTVVRGGTVDLAAVTRAAPAVADIAGATSSARARVDDLPRSTWLSPVDTATASLRDQLASLGDTLRDTDQALQVLPTMLGGDGRTRRYFVAFQNNAELRGTGGLPGAFAIVAATNGTVSVERFESDNLLQGVIPTGLQFGTAFDAHYAGDEAYSQYVNSNLSPHFPYAAQIWCAMWKQVTGQQLDGALTLDPGALSHLLEATGPATAPDGQQVTADNVVALLEKDVYAQFPERGENDDRKQFILGVASAVEKKILAGAGNGRALLQGLVRSVDERRIVVWSSDPTAQAVLAGATIGGTVSATDQPYSQLVVNNGAGGKLDYYLGRALSVTRTGCGDTRDVVVRIALTNAAPASGLPPYVTDRIGVTPPPGYVTGQNRTVVDYVATTGAQLLGASLDGQTSGAGIFDEQGHPSFETTVEIKPGQTVTWELRLREPAGSQPVTVVSQPGVTPTAVTLDDRSCS